MDKLHILFVCPDGNNFNLIKQTGTLALAFAAAEIQVSIMVGQVNTSPLNNIHPNINTIHINKKNGWFPNIVQQPLHMRRRLKKYLSKDHTVDIVHFTCCKWPYSLLAKVPEKLQIPTISNANSEQDITGDALNFWQKSLHKKALLASKPLIVSSNNLLETARKQNLSDVAYIPYGIQTEQFKPVLSKRPIRRELGLPEKATLICCMAEINPDNAQLETLEKCLPLSEGKHLFFIGKVTDKQYIRQLKKSITQHRMTDFVHFIDAVDNPEEYLKASDVFILLGGIEERHTTILEAQSAGLPVILAPSANALMLSNGNRCGVVLYPNNPLAKQAFDKLLDDPSYRQGRSINTRAYVRKEFSLGKMLQAYHKLYKSL